jgi:hypothetical protein
MRTRASVAVLLLLVSGYAHAYVWSSAVPTEVHIVNEGLLLVGPFAQTGVTCVTGPQAILLPSTDALFKEKVSVALMAVALGRPIQVLLGNGSESDCVQISAMGWVPRVHGYYWQMK